MAQRIAYKYIDDIKFATLYNKAGEKVKFGTLDLVDARLDVLIESGVYRCRLLVDDVIDCIPYTDHAASKKGADVIIKRMTRNVRTAQRKTGRDNVASNPAGTEKSTWFALNSWTKDKLFLVAPGSPAPEVAPEVTFKATAEAPKPELSASIAKAAPAPVSAGSAAGGLEEVLRNTVLSMATSPEVVDAISATIDGLIKAREVTPHSKTLEIKTAARPEGVVVKNPHKSFEDLLKLVAAGLNVYLVGPAGSGKSYAAKAVAKSLGLDYYAKSVSALTPVHEFFGYMNANGNFVETDFYQAFKYGGLFLLDELDNGNPNVLAALNMATANGECSFACGMVQKHPDFRVVAAGNTWGFGATTEYVGRNPIDAATLDRFFNLAWDYDEDLERRLAGNDAWTNKIQKLRAVARRKRVLAVISPRASINGALALKAGLSEAKVLEMLVFNGLEPEDVKMLRSEL